MPAPLPWPCAHAVPVLGMERSPGMNLGFRIGPVEGRVWVRLGTPSAPPSRPLPRPLRHRSTVSPALGAPSPQGCSLQDPPLCPVPPGRAPLSDGGGPHAAAPRLRPQLLVSPESAGAAGTETGTATPRDGGLAMGLPSCPLYFGFAPLSAPKGCEVLSWAVPLVPTPHLHSPFSHQERAPHLHSISGGLLRLAGRKICPQTGSLHAPLVPMSPPSPPFILCPQVPQTLPQSPQTVTACPFPPGPSAT